VTRSQGTDPGGLVVEQESLSLLPRHARISIGFVVERVLELSVPGGSGLEGIALSEVAVAHPWQKDYDAIDGNGPLWWAERFDLTHWGLLGAYEHHERVGGAVIAHRTPGVDMLEGRDELAVLWDLRIAPQARGRGIGSALFRAVEDWARERGCTELKVETQNINVPACRFYARMGCTLGAINTRAYPQLSEEAQLLWYRAL
jgi:GNAT superfamily N-acetyltransferase